MRAIVAAVAALSAAAAAAQPSSWERTFASRGGPARIAVTARYVDARGGEHRLALWRDGERRLVRRTDERLTLLVTRDPAGELRMRLFDGARRLEYAVSRSSLQRIGVLGDWTALATLLSAPHGEFRLAARQGERTPAGACRWYEVTQPNDAGTRVCWSERLHVALRIEARTAAGWQRRLTVDEVHVDRLDEAVFAAPDGFQRIDADRDLASE